MIRLLFITDYTESFAYSLLKGIISYSQDSESEHQWVVSRMPSPYKQKLGMDGVANLAREIRADVVIGQFEPDDDLNLLLDSGIIVFAQDYKRRFKNIPNITANYIRTGEMAAEQYIDKGFTNFAYFGYNDVCWSDERYQGFRERVYAAGYKKNFFEYRLQNINDMWYLENSSLTSWLRSLPKPIGIMACDDNQASVLVEACSIAGLKVPSDISIIGVDNDEVIDNLSSPTISSIAIGIEEAGREVARQIEFMFKHKGAVVGDVVLQPLKVVPRMSTAAYATDNVHIQKAIRHIHRNLDKKLSVSDVLSVVPLSRRLLEIKFKEVTGYSVYDYINKVHLDYFADLLLVRDESINEIAQMVGEDDSKRIGRNFKQYKGMTPNEWRLARKRNF